MNKEILIIKNIAREGPGLIEDVLHEAGISFEIFDLSETADFPSLDNYKTLIVLGGPDSANDATNKMLAELKLISRAINLDMPYLGICLGMQTLVKAAGGKVVKNPVKEIGFFDSEENPYTIELTQEGMFDPLFSGLGNSRMVFQLHGETVVPTREFNVLATGKHCANQIVKIGNAAYGIQCHFELTEELLKVWADEDDDLKKLDKAKLMTDFKKMEVEYTSTGKRCIKNFLKIAGF